MLKKSSGDEDDIIITGKIPKISGFGKQQKIFRIHQLQA